MSTNYLPVARQIIAMLPTATKTFADARQIALTTLGDGVVRKIKLEPESSLVYQVEVIVGQKTFELVIDARTGAARPK